MFIRHSKGFANSMSIYGEAKPLGEIGISTYIPRVSLLWTPLCEQFHTISTFVLLMRPSHSRIGRLQPGVPCQIRSGRDGSISINDPRNATLSDLREAAAVWCPTEDSSTAAGLAIDLVAAALLC